MVLRVLAALTLSLGLALAPDPALAPAPDPSTADALVASAERWVEAIARGEPDAVGTARVAIGLAGEAVVPRLAARLDEAAPAGEGTPWAWALGVAAVPAAPGDEAPPVAVDALRRAIAGSTRAPDWRCRVAAASALGGADVRSAAADVSALLLEPDVPREAEGPLLLALAGCGGPVARAHLETLLERGGDRAWSAAVLALAARYGGTLWPELVRAASVAPDVEARGTAAAALLLLAEPASACAIAERSGHEPDPAVRRVLLQALAAAGGPFAESFLAQVARADDDPEIAAVAAQLAGPIGPRRLDRGSIPSTAEVRAALRAIERGGAGADLRVVEQGATLLDVPWIERTLRRLPLREDDTWRDDHARLAQLRARTICAADDCG